MSRDDLKEKLVGDSARRTIIQLVIASVFVGVVLALVGLSPADFWGGVFDGVKGVISTIGDSLGEVVVNLLTYLVLGAAIVVPVWLVARLLTGGGKR
ncbi:MAG: hypothetical protein KDA46_03645 [Parvularculaceae bacterium]|nr:hypothetical protein [Parvularculaceae bacterium]